MTDELNMYEQGLADELKRMEDAAGHLLTRLKALQTYFDLDEEELDMMEPNGRADCVRQLRLINESLSAYYKTRKGGDA